MQSSNERRSEARISCDKAVEIMFSRPSPGQAFQPAKIIETSPSGLGLISKQPMAEGDQFILKLKLAQVMMVSYIVCHCQPVDGGYRIGARFDAVIDSPGAMRSDAVLKALLELT